MVGGEVGDGGEGAVVVGGEGGEEGGDAGEDVGFLGG